MKFVLPFALLALLAVTGCNTIENRRSLYTSERVHGPYTRALDEGTWTSPKTVDEQYADVQTQKRRPKFIPSETKPMVNPGGAIVAPVTADPTLPQ